MKRLWIKFGAVFGGWTLLAVMLAADQYALMHARGTPTAFLRLLPWAALDYWIWAALTPLAFWTASKFRFARTSWASSVAAHCAACIAFSLLHVTAAMVIGIPRGPSAAGLSLAALKARLFLDIYSDVWMYGTLVGLWNLLEYQKRYRERTMHALQLESQLAQAQLVALRSQMQPHFLFNTLNSISALMQDDVRAAEDMLADLSYMLRVALEGDATQEVRLADELDLLQAYIRIQKKRFEDRLQVEIVAPAETLESLVPSLVLQSLVENAVRHGVGPLSRPGRVHIASRKEGHTLVLTVSDNGRGLPPAYQEGVGLSNTRKRLKQLYGAEGNLDLRSAPDQGVSATVILPFRFAETRVEEHA